MSSGNAGSSDAWDCRHDSSNHGSTGRGGRSGTPPLASTSPYNTSYYSQPTAYNSNCDSTTNDSGRYISTLTYKSTPVTPQAKTPSTVASPRNYSSQPRPRVVPQTAPTPPITVPKSQTSSTHITSITPSKVIPQDSHVIDSLPVPVLSPPSSIGALSSTGVVTPGSNAVSALVDPQQTPTADTAANSVREPVDSGIATPSAALHPNEADVSANDIASSAMSPSTKVKQEMRAQGPASVTSIDQAMLSQAQGSSPPIDYASKVGQEISPRPLVDDSTPMLSVVNQTANTPVPLKLSVSQAPQSEGRPQRRYKKVWIIIFVGLVVVAVVIGVSAGLVLAKRKKIKSKRMQG